MLMATGSVAAESSAEHSKRLVLCLDGTWNNPYDEQERIDRPAPSTASSQQRAPIKVIKPSNPLKLCRAVLPIDSTGRDQIAYYHGIGEFLMVQVAFSLLMNILGNAAYDLVKQEFLEWRAGRHDSALNRAPVPRSDTDHHAELRRTLVSLGFSEAEIGEFAERVGARLQPAEDATGGERSHT